MKNCIADYNDKVVKSVVSEICSNIKKPEEKLEAIFYYVRDNIKFGFLPGIDNYTASEIIKLKVGQCNNKSGVFLALCKAAGLESKIHFSGIKKEIQKGLFRGIAYKFMPKEISHSWIEVKLDNKWIKVDSFINDNDFYNNGLNELKKNDWKTGYSISCESGTSSSSFDLNGNSFVQMDAVTEDFSTYDDPSDFYKSNHYKNRPNIIKKIIYLLSLRGINNRVNKIRKSS